MQTTWKRADKITTEHHVVTGGDTNPLNPGGKRRAWKVAETVITGGRTRLRLVLRGGAAHGTDGWLDESFENPTKLRVTEPKTKGPR